MGQRFSRRDVLIGGLSAAALIAAGCARDERDLAFQPRLSDRSADAPAEPVSVQRCESYDPSVVQSRLATALDQIGGLAGLVRQKTVTVKINLTGRRWDAVGGRPPGETYQTHPHIVGALCAILADAGARRIVIVESLPTVRPFDAALADAGWDIEAIRSAGNHRVSFEDTRNRGLFRTYSSFPVPWGGYVFPAFHLNQRLDHTDVLISLAKLKQHGTAGISGAVKNCFGLTPSALYGDDGAGERAVGSRVRVLHEGRAQPAGGAPQELSHRLPADPYVRVPRIVADIFGARQPDLCLVEAITSLSGGEGPWQRGISPVQPKLLLVGRNGVCTDAVGAAVMGFNPQAATRVDPFPGENHLNLLAAAGVGTNDLGRIEVRGVPLGEAVCAYADGACRGSANAAGSRSIATACDH